MVDTMLTAERRELMRDAGQALRTARIMATAIQYLLDGLIEDSTGEEELAKLEAINACIQRVSDAVNRPRAGDLPHALLSLAEVAHHA